MAVYTGGTNKPDTYYECDIRKNKILHMPSGDEVIRTIKKV